MLNRR